MTNTKAKTAKHIKTRPAMIPAVYAATFEDDCLSKCLMTTVLVVEFKRVVLVQGLVLQQVDEELEFVICLVFVFAVVDMRSSTVEIVKIC